MEDLSTISRALQEALASSSSDEDSLTQLLERYLHSNDPAVRRAVVEVLAEVLDAESDDQEAKRRMILEESALTYIPALLPILPDAPVSVRTIMGWISDLSRPREVVMALNEALQGLEEKAEGVILSDDEDEGNFEREGTDHEVLVEELGLILESYATVVSRLPNSKSTPTLLALSDAIGPVIPRLNEGFTPETARRTLVQLSALIEASWKWSQTTSDKGGEQKLINKTLLSNLLFMAITLLTPSIDAHLLEQWFVSTFPRFGGLRQEPDYPVEGAQALQSAMKTAQALGHTPSSLQERLITPSSNSPYASLAVLTLLASGVVSSPSETEVKPGPLGDSMPVLSAALSSSAIDSGLVWVWSSIHRGATLEVEAASMLLELIMPLASFTMKPTTRTALLKLIEAIIQTQSSSDKLTLFKELLDQSNPFDNLRIQSIPILRQQLSTDPTLLTPLLLVSLSPILFTLPTAEDAQGQEGDILSLSLDDLVGEIYPSWMTECANLLWFLLDLDTNNASGIRTESTLGRIREEWLQPIKKRVEVLKVESEKKGDVGVMFILERWYDAVQRASEAVEKELA